MDYITTTDLRFKASKLKDSLREGKSTYLVHRSGVIGVISPYKETEVKFDPIKFKDLVNELSTGVHIPIEKRKELYRKHLKEKYGKGLS